MRKLICLCLVLCMLAALFAGCANQKDPSEDKGTEAKTVEQILKKDANLVMYVIGGKPNGADEVMDELNKLIKRDLNASLTINYMSWGDWKTKYPLVLTSGEKVDLIYTADWAFYGDQARKGAFAELENLIPTYTPKLHESIPAEGWKQATINDHIYMVPSNKNEYDVVAFMYRKDLGDKYGAPDITDWKSFEEYCDVIKANEPGMLPFNAGEGDLKLIDLTYTGMERDVYIALHTEDTNAYVKLDDFQDPNFTARKDEYDEGFLDWLKMMRRFQEKGFWSKSVLGNATTSTDAFANGTSAIALCNLENGNNFYRQLKKNFPDAEVGFYNVYGNRDRIISLPLISNGMAVVRTSQEQERALMLMEKFHTDEEYYRLSTYGIEGRDYVIEEDGTMGTIETETGGGIGSAWGWGCNALELKSNDNMPQYNTLKEDYATRTAYNPMAGFSPEIESVQAEYSAYTNVMRQYKMPLVWGLIEDVEAGYEELLTKLEEAGYDIYIAEIEKQFKEYAATLKE